MPNRRSAFFQESFAAIRFSLLKRALDEIELLGKSAEAPARRSFCFTN
jgi:hypothetical protein